MQLVDGVRAGHHRDHVVARGRAWGQEAFECPSLVDAVATYLHRTVEAITRTDHPHGCLVVQSVSKCSPEAGPVRDHVAQGEDDPAMTADPATLALLLAVIAEGMAVRANDGTPAAELHAAVDLSVAALFPVPSARAPAPVAGR